MLIILITLNPIIVTALPGQKIESYRVATNLTSKALVNFLNFVKVDNFIKNTHDHSDKRGVNLRHADFLSPKSADR